MRAIEVGACAVLAVLAGAAWAHTGSGLAGLACACGVALAGRVALRAGL